MRWLMALHSSFQRTMKVVILHGSSNKFNFKLERNHVLNHSKFKFVSLLV